MLPGAQPACNAASMTHHVPLCMVPAAVVFRGSAVCSAAKMTHNTADPAADLLLAITLFCLPSHLHPVPGHQPGDCCAGVRRLLHLQPGSQLLGRCVALNSSVAEGLQGHTVRFGRTAAGLAAAVWHESWESLPLQKKSSRSTKESAADARCSLLPARFTRLHSRCLHFCSSSAAGVETEKKRAEIQLEVRLLNAAACLSL